MPMDFFTASGDIAATARLLSVTFRGVRNTRRRSRIFFSAGGAGGPAASLPGSSASGTSASPSESSRRVSSASRRRPAFVSASSSAAGAASASGSLESSEASASASAASAAFSAFLPFFFLSSFFLGGGGGGGGGGSSTSTMSNTSTWYSALSMYRMPELSTAKCALILPRTPSCLAIASFTPATANSATVGSTIPGGSLCPAETLWYTVNARSSVALGMDTMRRTGKRLCRGSRGLRSPGLEGS